MDQTTAMRQSGFSKCIHADGSANNQDENQILSSIETPNSTDWLSLEAQSLFFSDQLYLSTEIVQMTSLLGLPRLLRKTYVRLFGLLPNALRDRLGCR